MKKMKDDLNGKSQVPQTTPTPAPTITPTPTSISTPTPTVTSTPKTTSSGNNSSSSTFLSKDKTPPVIGYTFSETTETSNPVIVNVIATDNRRVKQIRWVKRKSDWSVPDGESASIPAGFDFFAHEREDTDEFYQQFGGLEKYLIVSSYYMNAYDEKYDENGECCEYIDVSMPVENNQLQIKQNDAYFLYAEDFAGNKTFVRFSVNNIKVPFADIIFTLNTGFSGDTIATAQIQNLSFNPNAPIKNMYFVKRFIDGRSGCSPDSNDMNLLIKQSIQRYIDLNLPIAEEDGIYQLEDWGYYDLFFEDEWGNFSSVSAKLENPVTEDTEKPIIEYSLSTDQKTTEPITVTFNITDNIAVAKVRWVKKQDILRPDWDAENVYFCNKNRMPLVDNKLEVTENGGYVICAMDTSGNTTYKMIKINNIVIK